MTKAEWLEKTLAGAPPLSPAQLAILRPIWRPTIPQDAAAAPARQSQEPLLPASTEIGA